MLLKSMASPVPTTDLHEFKNLIVLKKFGGKSPDLQISFANEFFTIILIYKV